MRKLITFCCLLLASCSWSGLPRSPEALGWGELNFKPQKPQEWRLANGLAVLLIEDDELPLVSGTLYVRGGSLNEPAELAGLASMTGAQMREGGIQGFSPSELDRRLDARGAKIESSFDAEFGSVGFFSLREDFTEVFQLFAEVALRPRFDKERLKLSQQLALDGIRRRADNPGTMAAMTFAEILYGKDSPYARYVTAESLSRIDLAAMRDFHRRFFRPDGSLLVVRGAISRAEIAGEIERLFGQWAPLKTPLPEVPKIDAAPRPGVYVLDRKFDQTTVMMGHLGPPRLTPDMYAMNVYNRIFGAGGFETVLFNEVRTKRGYAYAVDGGLFPGADKGTFQINIGTRTEQALNAVKTALEVTRKTSAELPDVQLFEDSKRAVERSFVFKFEGTDDILQRAAMLRLLGYPLDYDDTYLEKMAGVTREDVKKVPQRWVRPEQMAIVLVGQHKPAEIKNALGPDYAVYEVKFDTAPRISSERNSSPGK